MYGAMNQGFFTGTTVESEAQTVLAAAQTARPAHV
jgi:hypothetical protein